MTPRNLAIFIICFAVISLAIALSFLSLGLWLVFPFTGLELFVVGVMVGCSVGSSQDYELIIIDENNVTITRRRARRTMENKFKRHWARVRLESGATRLQPSRLRIGSHGHFVDVAGDMTETDRGDLATRLRQVLHG